MTQLEHSSTRAYPLPQIANGYATIQVMPEPKRGQDEIVRQNLKYIIEACSKRLGSSRGGQSYLASIIPSTPQYLSSVVKGYDNRNLGRSNKTRLEELFKLEKDWMDREHDESVVEWLVPRVPLLPRQRKAGNPSGPSGYVGRLERTVHDLQRRLSELESQLESKSNTRK